MKTSLPLNIKGEKKEKTITKQEQVEFPISIVRCKKTESVVLTILLPHQHQFSFIIFRKYTKVVQKRQQIFMAHSNIDTTNF